MNKVDKFTAAAVKAGTGQRSVQPEPVRRCARRSHRHEPRPLLRRRRDHAGRHQLRGQHRAARSSTARSKGCSTQAFRTRSSSCRTDAQLTSKQSGFIRWAWQKAEFICEGVRRPRGERRQHADPARCARRRAHLGARAAFPERGPLQRAPSRSCIRRRAAPRIYKTLDFAPERFTGGTPTYIFPSFTWGNDLVFITGQTDPGVARRLLDLRLVAQHQVRRRRPERDARRGRAGQSERHVELRQRSAVRPEQPTWPRCAGRSTPSRRHSRASSGDQPHHYYQFYAQDEWKAGGGLTLNLGLRYELDTLIWNENRKNDGSFYPAHPAAGELPGPRRHQQRVAAPRLAWDVRNNGKTVVRAGYGRLFNTIMNGTPGAEETTLRQTAISINNPTYPDPYGGRSPASFASTAPPNIAIVDDNMVNPWADTVSLGVVAAARRRHGDQRRRRQHQVERVQRQRADQHAAQRREAASRVGAHQPGAVNRMAEVPRDARAPREAAIRAATSTPVSYTLQKVEDNSFGATSTGTITDFYHPEYDAGTGTPTAVTRWSPAARTCCPGT